MLAYQSPHSGVCLLISYPIVSSYPTINFNIIHLGVEMRALYSTYLYYEV